MNNRVVVLVVEDEPIIRFDIVEELESYGFKVFEAGSAAEAITLLITHLDIRLMFTDVDMLPGIDGLKLAAIVRSRWPPIKIIVTSGIHSVTSDMMPLASRFIPKPYEPAQVIAAIGEMIMA
jgi:two-component system, response regulator PdtaR